MHVCVYVCIYTHIHVYTYTYTHIHYTHPILLPLAYKNSAEKSAYTLIDVPFYVMTHFFLIALKTLTFDSSIIMCLLESLFKFIILAIHQASWVCRFTYCIIFRKCLAITSSIISLPLSLSSTYETLTVLMLIFLISPTGSLGSVHFFTLLVLCFSELIC